MSTDVLFSSFDRFIINWLENIELDYFGWDGEGYYDDDRDFLEWDDCGDYILCFKIKAIDKSYIDFVLFEDEIRNPKVSFHSKGFYFSYNADLSICESIIKLITERHPNYMKECYNI